MGDDGVKSPLFSIGFQLEVKVENRTRVILAGSTKIEKKEQKDADFEQIRPESEVLLRKDVYEDAGQDGANSLIGTAVQCEAKGWSGFAAKLLAIALASHAGHPN